MHLVLIVALLAGHTGCQTGPEGSTAGGSSTDGSTAPTGADLDQLASWMTGTFSSAAQHAARPDDFFDIRLVMFPIWVDRTDGRWFYVEQAAADTLDTPYRQRVYHLTAQPDGTFQSDVYTIRDSQERFVGCWRHDTTIQLLGPGGLRQREGCSIVLRSTRPETVEGSTVGEECPSGLGGAAYATSEVTITAKGMTSWDRGWDSAGQQVWGATAGPYEFGKISARMP